MKQQSSTDQYDLEVQRYLHLVKPNKPAAIVDIRDSATYQAVQEEQTERERGPPKARRAVSTQMIELSSPTLEITGLRQGLRRTTSHDRVREPTTSQGDFYSSSVVATLPRRGNLGSPQSSRTQSPTFSAERPTSAERPPSSLSSWCDKDRPRNPSRSFTALQAVLGCGSDDEGPPPAFRRGSRDFARRGSRSNTPISWQVAPLIESVLKPAPADRPGEKTNIVRRIPQAPKMKPQDVRPAPTYVSPVAKMPSPRYQMSVRDGSQERPPSRAPQLPPYAPAGGVTSPMRSKAPMLPPLGPPQHTYTTSTVPADNDVSVQMGAPPPRPTRIKVIKVGTSKYQPVVSPLSPHQPEDLRNGVILTTPVTPILSPVFPPPPTAGLASPAASLPARALPQSDF